MKKNRRSHSTFIQKSASAVVFWSLYVSVLFGLGFTNPASAQGLEGITTNLQINIESQNQLSGVLEIRSSSLKTSTSIYFVLPFRVQGEVTADKGIITSYKILDGGPVNGYTVLTAILSPKITEHSEISFGIQPVVLKSSDFAFGNLGSESNYFLIEDRGSSRNTLYFRFDVTGKQSFGTIAWLTDAMVIPAQIKVNFPLDTSFYTTPPYFVSSNINEGAHPGSQEGNSFITAINFYENDLLRINYVLNSVATRPGVIIYVTILLLITFVPGILAFPDDMLARKIRLWLAAFCIVLSPLLFLFNLWYEGSQYLAENMAFLIGGIIAYVFITFVLLIQMIPQFKVWWANRKNKKPGATQQPGA